MVFLVDSPAVKSKNRLTMETFKKNILFIPGMACSSQIWSGLDSISQNYQCTFLDWPLDKMQELQTLDDCAIWLTTEILKLSPDFLIGHSLGGLALLKAQENNLIRGKKIVAIESFLNAPAIFFQNLVGPFASKDLEPRLREMLDNLCPFFSKKLKTSLKNEALVAPQKIHNTLLVYGMRGDQDAQKVLKLLPGVDKMDDTNQISLLPYSGHFPMIEEPQELEETILQFLE